MVYLKNFFFILGEDFKWLNFVLVGGLVFCIRKRRKKVGVVICFCFLLEMICDVKFNKMRNDRSFFF